MLGIAKTERNKTERRQLACEWKIENVTHAGWQPAFRPLKVIDFTIENDVKIPMRKGIK